MSGAREDHSLHRKHFWTTEETMSRIDELLQQMTPEEKISMLAGADLWHSLPVPRLGIPQFKVTD